MNHSAECYPETVTVVIRACGERTAAACRSLIEQQVPAESVLVVQEVPFEQALRKTYALAIERGSRWTVTVDADVLLRRDAIATLVGAAEQANENVVELEGWCYDKIVGKYRAVGHRIYRTSVLRQALQWVPADGTQIRPENYIITKFREQGLLNLELPLAVGVHDFEQSYCDLYRKSFVHSQKFIKLLPKMIDRCRQERATDVEFEVILAGLVDGLMAMESARIDISRYPRDADFIREKFGWDEKLPLALAGVTFENVESILEAVGPPQCDAMKRTVMKRITDRVRRSGMLRSIPHFLGVALTRIGQRLECRP